MCGVSPRRFRLPLPDELRPVRDVRPLEDCGGSTHSSGVLELVRELPVEVPPDLDDCLESEDEGI